MRGVLHQKPQGLRSERVSDGLMRLRRTAGTSRGGHISGFRKSVVLCIFISSWRVARVTACGVNAVA